MRELKAVPRAEGAEEILYPGEGRERRIRRRSREGIPLSREVVSDLEELGPELRCSFPGPMGREESKDKAERRLNSRPSCGRPFSKVSEDLRSSATSLFLIF